MMTAASSAVAEAPGLSPQQASGPALPPLPELPPSPEVDGAASGLSEAEAARRLEQCGRNEVPERVTPWHAMLLRQFAGPMPGMIGAAALLSLVITCVEPDDGPWPDFLICSFMLLLNATLGFREELHASRAARALRQRVRPQVSVRRGGANRMVDAALLVPGDVIFLKAGQRVPADCDWTSGDPMGVDNSVLNGESRLDKVGPTKPTLWSGALVRTGGGSHCVVQRTGRETMIGEAAAAMQDGGPGKGEFQRTIERLVRYVIVVALSMVVVLIVVQIGVRRREVLQTLLACVSLLIGSVPVALPVVLTVTLALGSARMAREGAIVTNLASLQEIAVMRVLCSDKTGTLTTAQMSVYPDRVWTASPECSADDVLTLAGLASNADNVDDPVDAAVLRACREHFGDAGWAARRERHATRRFAGFDPSTKRVCAFLDGADGRRRMVGKGLIGKVLDTGGDAGAVQWECAGGAALRAQAEAADARLAADAFKTISVCVAEGAEWEVGADGSPAGICGAAPMRLAGIVPMRDPPRRDTAATVARIRGAGVRVKMVTGDHLDIAVKTAEQIELGAGIQRRGALFDDEGRRRDAAIDAADGFAEVVPKDKHEVIKSLQARGYTVGMTGDGVNDAAALSAANVGIAVAGAVDAARAASDIILTDGGLAPIHSAIIESRCIFQRLRSYVIYRIAHSIHVVGTLAILVLGFDFVLDPLYVILMALFNDLAITMIGYDDAVPTQGPSVPRVSTMLVMAAATGGAQTVSSILLFRYGDAFPLSHDFGSLAPESYGEYRVQDDEYIGTCLFLQMASTAGLLMLSTRTRGFVLSGNPPNPRLALSIGCAFVVTFFMSGFRTVHVAIAWADVGAIWAYNVVWAVVIEAVKLLVLRWMPEVAAAAGPGEREERAEAGGRSEAAAALLPAQPAVPAAPEPAAGPRGGGAVSSLSSSGAGGLTASSPCGSHVRLFASSIDAGSPPPLFAV